MTPAHCAASVYFLENAFFYKELLYLCQGSKAARRGSRLCLFMAAVGHIKTLKINDKVWIKAGLS
ncbi:MAG: hypothetical protein GC185_07480 [Alphaproteobacteria bacterium]|nr:hypothetical protein [Alphaproteobacteria bacterium]